MKNFDFKKIEKKWQKIWDKEKIFQIDNSKLASAKKIYILDMFPYPSGEGLHVGHVEGYTASDVLSRFYRANGHNVLHPMGWDAFGLPAENYAIKKKISPEVVVKNNVANFKKQIKSLGLSYDWSREINTTDPDYYKWTQWIFLQLFKKGLAYEKEMPVNWCLSCKTVLADEEVKEGVCDRCHSKVERKSLKQWMLNIRAYADRLTEDLDGLDWPQRVKTMQKNWIGRSKGALIKFEIVSLKPKASHNAEVFTTRPDTIFGATYLVLAPEHEIIKSLIVSNRKEVDLYIKKSKNRSDEDRIANKEKTGIKLDGIFAINPATGEKIPVFIADYVLPHYGTGSIMAVPAHDERDFEFAKKFNLPIKTVINPDTAGEEVVLPYLGDGVLLNSGKFNKKTSSQVVDDIIDFVKGKKEIQYKLRDWIFARQRYWGEPFPVVFCEHCKEQLEISKSKLSVIQLKKKYSDGEIKNPGWVPVNEKDLPVRLPKVKKYEPTGSLESPLAGISSWVNVECPRCKGRAKRETNTMPQWAGSCWYYLRYIDPKNRESFVDKRYEKKAMPVDIYIGGVEHAVLHLLYARFWHKVLYDIGAVSQKEPFKKLINQGLILGPDGDKMSKSKGNVINPDNVIERFGADSLRMYEMFMGPLEDPKPWSENGIVGIFRFLERVWKISQLKLKDEKKPDLKKEILINKTIKKVSEDIKEFKFNTAISALMTALNDMEKWDFIPKQIYKKFILILSPLAPFICEEIWQNFGEKKLISLEKWPSFDKKIVVDEEISFVVQFNGKVRGIIKTKRGATREDLLGLISKDGKLSNYLSVGEAKRVIFVPDKVINIIC